MTRGIEGQPIFRDYDDRVCRHLQHPTQTTEAPVSESFQRYRGGRRTLYSRVGSLYPSQPRSCRYCEECRGTGSVSIYWTCGAFRDARLCRAGCCVCINALLRPTETAVAAYSRFVADGFDQGRREELRGGGLIRSAGGVAAIVDRHPEDRDLSDERILGGGNFVASVLHDSEHCGDREKPFIDEILNDVAKKSGVSRELILGASRSRSVSRARTRRSDISDAWAVDRP